MHLAAEVEHLRAELAAAQVRLAELEARADVDPLLGILNRRGIERELNRTMAYLKRYGGSAALIYLDLDDFKLMNDTHGHAAGDAVLGAIAAALVRNVRVSDSVGRLGGDEFAVVLWNLDSAQTAAKAKALENIIAATEVRWNSFMLKAGASAGFVMLDGRDRPADLISRADDAMYARKRERSSRRASREPLMR